MVLLGPEDVSILLATVPMCSQVKKSSRHLHKGRVRSGISFTFGVSEWYFRMTGHRKELASRSDITTSTSCVCVVWTW